LASLASARAEACLWAREPEVVDSVKRWKENGLFLPGFRVPDVMAVTGDLQECLTDVEVAVIAVPAQHLRTTITAARPFLPPNAVVVCVAKGIERGTLLRMSEVLAEVLVDHDPRRIGVLSGPNLAREVMDRQPTATCVAFPDLAHANTVQNTFLSDTLRVYTSDDVVGCETGGAAKNVIAIAAGVADGLGCGLNTKAALISRGLAEITRLGVALGGRPLTFLGLAGNGDLIATCSSPQSRNRRLGEELATGASLEEVIGTTRSVAEGAETAPALVELARRVGIEMPISESVAALLRGDISVTEIVPLLMRRSPKQELDGLGG
jgi:glycerol-3-phosphate dehydrogenase (NAD(P)+)